MRVGRVGRMGRIYTGFEKSPWGAEEGTLLKVGAKSASFASRIFGSIYGVNRRVGRGAYGKTEWCNFCLRTW